MSSTAIPTDSLVLVTGANGFIASHIVDTLLTRGYRVRGTVRSEAKGSWLQSLFASKHGADRFSFVIVPDLSIQDAIRDAVKGCTAVAHVASDMSFSSDPNAVIPGVVNSIRYILEAVAEERSVKRFVLTSSSTAALNPKPDTKFTVTEETWNDEAVVAAWADPPYEPTRAWAVYAASKTQGEREMWKFVKEREEAGKKLGFEVNSVLPNANFGPLLNVEEHRDSSTSGWITSLYGAQEVPEKIGRIPPQYFVNVTDTALLHFAALTNPTITNQRIFAFAAPFTWNEVLANLRRIAPDVTFPKDINDDRHDLSVIEPAKKAAGILKELKGGGEGFVGLEESLRQNIQDL